MIASLIHKYLRDEMMKEPTTTKIIVDEFKLVKTTIHRQIWGKKYPGGSQKLENVREPKTTAKASGSGSAMKKVAAVIIKRNVEMEKLAEEHTVETAKKGKGKGKTSLGKPRSAADIQKGIDCGRAETKKTRESLGSRKRRMTLICLRRKQIASALVSSKPAKKSIIIH